MNTIRLGAAILMSAAFATAAQAAKVDDTVSQLQQRWAELEYATPQAEQKQGYAGLAAEADRARARYPDRAEVLIWHGIIDIGYAGARRDRAALGLVKDARKDFETALRIDPQALSGAAYTILGSLYSQVPRWPIAFGDDRKAHAYLKQGLAADPDGIDANFFYGDYLFRKGELAGAERHLRKALQAPSRPGRELDDAGRRRDIGELLARIAARRQPP